IAGARHGEESMTGAVVAVEFGILAGLLYPLFRLVHVMRGGVLVVVPVDAEDGRSDLFRQLDRRHRPLLRIALVVGELVAAPAIYGGVHIRQRTGAQPDVAAAGAEADQPGLSVALAFR